MSVDLELYYSKPRGYICVDLAERPWLTVVVTLEGPGPMTPGITCGDEFVRGGRLPPSVRLHAAPVGIHRKVPEALKAVLGETVDGHAAFFMDGTIVASNRPLLKLLRAEQELVLGREIMRAFARYGRS